MNVILPPGTKIMTRNATQLVFELPDLQHEVHIMLYTNRIYLSVYMSNAVGRKEDASFDLRKATLRWEDIAQAFIDSAVRKYPKPIRHKSVSDERIRRGW